MIGQMNFLKKDGTKMKPSEIIEDYRDDHYANLYGRLQGL